MTPSDLALVADVGGTNVRFALAHRDAGGHPRLMAIEQLAIADFPSVIDAARAYLRGRHAPRWGVLGIAGRVEDDRAAMTNHPWRIVGAECAQALGLERISLINDFTAQALAVAHLDESERLALGGDPSAPAGRSDLTYAVLGPGTGLGVSALLRRGGREFALASEGGHASFAPKTERQRAVLEHLASRFSRVSYERVVSGNGLSTLHWALSRRDGLDASVDLPPESITSLAAQGDARCRETLEVFCEVFGAFAGDLVLTFGAWDGVFLSGGLVPVLLEEIRGPAFRTAFESKGRFSAAMARVPVHAVMHPQAGLLGAAAEALRP